MGELDQQKVIESDRAEAIANAKAAATANANTSINEFLRSIQKTTESLAVKPFQG